MTAESYVDIVGHSCYKVKVYEDTLVRLHQLTTEIPQMLNTYADINGAQLANISTTCRSVIRYFGKRNYIDAKQGLLRFNCGSFKPKSGKYEEVLTYYQDKWKLEIIGIWLSISFLEEKDINSVIRDDIEKSRVINIINDQYNQMYAEVKSWDF